MSDDEGSDYKVAAKVDLKTLAEMDADDESLARYKASLAADDPRRVVIISMTVIFEDRPDGDIVYDLDTPAKVDAMKDTPFTLKEGCHYKIKVVFRVQHEIVSGLKYVNQVFRKGVKVVKEEEMLGSFGPQEAPHEVVFPRHGWEEAPSGMLYRGKYSAQSKYVDDDKETHLQYEYAFAIKKNW